MALFDTEGPASRTDASGGFALVLIVAVLSTLVLDAYAFSVFVGA